LPIQIIAPFRQTDSQGSGHYGASRGSRVHNGIDIACYPKSVVLSHVAGTVTKIGYPYADKLEFRYVEITDESSLRHRFFYVDPLVKVGWPVKVGDQLGMTQELPYSGITQHVHYEIKNNEGNFLDPNDYI